MGESTGWRKLKPFPVWTLWILVNQSFIGSFIHSFNIHWATIMGLALDILMNRQSCCSHGTHILASVSLYRLLSLPGISGSLHLPACDETLLPDSHQASPWPPGAALGIPPFHFLRYNKYQPALITGSCASSSLSLQSPHYPQCLNENMIWIIKENSEMTVR